MADDEEEKGGAAAEKARSVPTNTELGRRNFVISHAIMRKRPAVVALSFQA
jgi:hypothetical protein